MVHTLGNFLHTLLARPRPAEADPRTLRLRLRNGDTPRRFALTPDAIEAEFERLVANRTVSLLSEDSVKVLDHRGAAVPPSTRFDPDVGRDGGPRTAAPEVAVVEPSTSRGALRSILADERFRAAPHTSMLLAYLVEQALSGEADRLDGGRISVEAFGGSTGHDPERGPVSRVLVARLQKLLDDCYDMDHVHDVVLRIVPGSRRLVIQNLPLNRLLSDEGGDRDRIRPQPARRERDDSVHRPVSVGSRGLPARREALTLDESPPRSATA